MEGVETDQVAVQLYGLVPDEFTAARNAAAKAAKDGTSPNDGSR